jgi:hypothetical protein
MEHGKAYRVRIFHGFRLLMQKNAPDAGNAIISVRTRFIHGMKRKVRQLSQNHLTVLSDAPTAPDSALPVRSLFRPLNF